MGLTVVLSYPPSSNHAYCVRNGRKVKSAEARAYAFEVQHRVANSRFTDPLGWKPTTTDRLAASIDVHAPDLRRRDIESTSKLAIDAACAQLGIDDSQIDVLTLRRQPVDRTNPRIILTLEALA